MSDANREVLDKLQVRAGEALWGLRNGIRLLQLGEIGAAEAALSKAEKDLFHVHAVFKVAAEFTLAEGREG